MLEKNDKLFLAAAGLCGLLAAASAVLYLKANTPKPIPTATVLVAARDLPANTTLQKGDIVEQTYPVIDDNFLKSTYSAAERDLTIGRTVSNPVPKGAFFSEPMFVPMTSFQIDPGYEGLAIAPRDTTNIAPGRYINVYVCTPRQAEVPAVPKNSEPAEIIGAMLRQQGADEVAPKLLLKGVLVKSVGNVLRDDQVTMSDELDDPGHGRGRAIMIQITHEQLQLLLAESRDMRLPLTVSISGDGRADALSAR
ncbi:MAG: hypothetical protein JSR77_13200 [Planctomycetes bacterium]|nr:hypothetical protein [Planctomycetota bacterium]